MSHADAIAVARARYDAGDLDGAERGFCDAIRADHPAAALAARALVFVAQQRGELSFRVQDAFDTFVARRPESADALQALLDVARLYASAGFDDAALDAYRAILAGSAAGSAPHEAARVEALTLGHSSRLLPDLPDLAAFGQREAPPTTDAAPRLDSLRSLAEGIAETGSGVFATAAPSPTQPPPLPPVPALPTTRPERSSNDIFVPGGLIGGRYQVRERIGRGGHGTVFRVFDQELGEDCALKVFHHTGSPEDLRRFKREVSLSRRIVHENVVTLFDLGQESGSYYLTLELLDGEDLASHLRATRLTLARGVDLVAQACRGLHAAHTRGVVHRDVKPGNLFVQRAGPLKVMDFGIAKPADSASLTSTGTFVGTPQFASPEQVCGREIGPASDIYSAGVVLYLVCAGVLPFREKELVALVMKHATATPPPPRQHNPELPRALDDLVMSCLAKEPAQRPASAAALAAALTALLPRL